MKKLFLTLTSILVVFNLWGQTQLNLDVEVKAGTFKADVSKGNATITNVYYTMESTNPSYRTANTYVIEGKQNKKDFKIVC